MSSLFREGSSLPVMSIYLVVCIRPSYVVYGVVLVRTRVVQWLVQPYHNITRCHYPPTAAVASQPAVIHPHQNLTCRRSQPYTAVYYVYNIYTKYTYMHCCNAACTTILCCWYCCCTYMIVHGFVRTCAKTVSTQPVDACIACYCCTTAAVASFP